MIFLLLLGLTVVLGISASRRKDKRRGCGCSSFGVLLVILIVFLLWSVALAPMGPSSRFLHQSATMQTCRAIALAMFAYANDHDGQYPDGSSSTEVFQKLVDGNYVSDPSIFFVSLPGKVRASGSKLKPENVAYDVTVKVDAQSSDEVPVVFLTGYRIDYRAGGVAVSRVKPFPTEAMSIWQRLIPQRGEFDDVDYDGLPIGYKSNNAFFRPARNGPSIQYTPDGYRIVPGVIASDFDPHGQNYRQLTPDGPLR